MSSDSNNPNTFAKFGRSYQERVVQALMSDYMFAEQLADILRPEFFELKYLQEIVERFFSYKLKYNTYPSIDLMEIMTTKGDEPADSVLIPQLKEYLNRCRTTPLNGDTGYIQTSSLEFCKMQTLKEALVKSIDMMESGNYDSIQSVIRDALGKGSTRDLGHDYNEDFAARGQKSVRQPIPTGWPILDKAFNGGWERKTLSTFIAPTGAGKSMFLVNCGAAALEQGLNVLYCSLEMADFKIGIRFDSYFSGVEINNISEKGDLVKEQIEKKVRGKLYIKEWPTKTATVQSIRSHLQRLTATKNFQADMLIVDYADLLRGARGYGDKRFELEGIYEELRALAQEFNIVVITADQTNRSGLDMEVVTIGQIGESYAKATVCDVIMTVSRRADDKQMNCGRLFLAKSRLGQDGVVYPFLLNTATVKVTLLETGVDPISLFMENQQNMKNKMGERIAKLTKNDKN